MEAKKVSSSKVVLIIAKVLILVAFLSCALYAANQMAIFESALQKNGMTRGDIYASPAFFYITYTIFAGAMIALIAFGIVFFVQKKEFRSFLLLIAIGVGSYLPVLVRDLSYTFAQSNYVLFGLMTAALCASIILYSLSTIAHFKAKIRATLATVGAICLSVMALYLFVNTIGEDGFVPSSGAGNFLLWPLFYALVISVLISSVFTSITLWLTSGEEERAALPKTLPPLTSSGNKIETLKAEPKKAETKKSEEKKAEEKKDEEKEKKPEDKKATEAKPEEIPGENNDAAI